MKLPLSTYERYLAREIYAGTALVLMAFLLLFAFFDLINEFASIGTNGYEFHHAVIFVLLTLPGRSYELFPIAVLIGTLYALTQLARHSEITVLRTSGLSTRQLLKTLSKIGLAFVLLTFLIGEFLAPPMERFAQRYKLEMTRNLIAQEFRTGLWVKDDKFFINVREVQPDGSLHKLRIYEFDGAYKLKSVSDAEEGLFDPANNQWLLDNIVQTVFDDDKAHVVRKEQMAWQSALNPDIVSVLMLAPERMSVISLVRYMRHLSENQQKTDRYEIALWKKLIYPLASLVMMGLALPFAYMQNRSGAVSLRVFSGVMIGISFHMLNGLFSNLGIINSWPPFSSAITPSALFLLASFAMLWWVERR